MTSSTPSPLGCSTGPLSLPSSPSASSTASTPAASSVLPNEKSQRYDRQLRLWGDHGQLSLERGHVCLLNATPTGTEILKSLVLPGLGAFTIVDKEKVEGPQLGSNFFVDIESVGQSRGAAATRLLLELNGEVRGDWLEESPAHLVKHRPDFFQAFTVVVATDLDEKALNALSAHLWAHNIPLIVVRSYGFIGYIRLQIKEHTIVESHPDNAFDDLRLLHPFPSLVKFMETQDLSTMTKEQHTHVPYLVILYKYLQQWKSQHDGQPPKNYKEKKEFKQLITEGVLKNADGIPEEEENFAEAVQAVNAALVPTAIPAHVQAIFKDEKCSKLTSSSSHFWIVCRALRDFVEAEVESDGQLPVRGAIPDMFSDSERYIQLQEVYRTKANEDAENVLSRARQLVVALGKPAGLISESTVRKYCRESFNLRLVRGDHPIANDFAPASDPGTNGQAAASSSARSDMAALFEQNPETEAMYYFILRGVDRFRTDSSAYPGALDDHVEMDIGKLKAAVTKILAESQLSSAVAIKDDYIHEVCRYGGAELHAMASIMGGMAAQEVIKLITGQYVLVDNLFIYSALTSKTITLKI